LYGAYFVVNALDPSGTERVERVGELVGKQCRSLGNFKCDKWENWFKTEVECLVDFSCCGKSVASWTIRVAGRARIRTCVECLFIAPGLFEWSPTFRDFEEEGGKCPDSVEMPPCKFTVTPVVEQ
jgi:hypothetical protein